MTEEEEVARISPWFLVYAIGRKVGAISIIKEDHWSIRVVEEKGLDLWSGKH